MNEKSRNWFQLAGRLMFGFQSFADQHIETTFARALRQWFAKWIESGDEKCFTASQETQSDEKEEKAWSQRTAKVSTHFFLAIWKPPQTQNI
jgi:hypothetical protein